MIKNFFYFVLCLLLLLSCSESYSERRALVEKYSSDAKTLSADTETYLLAAVIPYRDGLKEFKNYAPEKVYKQKKHKNAYCRFENQAGAGLTDKYKTYVWFADGSYRKKIRLAREYWHRESHEYSDIDLYPVWSRAVLQRAYSNLGSPDYINHEWKFYRWDLDNLSYSIQLGDWKIPIILQQVGKNLSVNFDFYDNKYMF